MKNISILTGFASLALAAGPAFAATINIDGRLADSTEASDLEWGDYSSTADTATISPSFVSDNDGTVTLTVATNGQTWNTSYSSGSYDAGEEWNVRQGIDSILPVSETAAASFTNGSYLSISLASTSSFDWTSVSASLWRNGAQAPDSFQFAVDTDNDGWDTGDLLGSTSVLAAGIAGADTMTANFASGVTGDEVRLYYWDTTGSNNAGGNFHVYDVSADYTAVPEPSSAALIGLGGFALILRRRK